MLRKETACNNPWNEIKKEFKARAEICRGSDLVLIDFAIDLEIARNVAIVRALRKMVGTDRSD